MPRTKKVRLTDGQIGGRWVCPLLVGSVVPEGRAWRVELIHTEGAFWGRRHLLDLPEEPPADGAWAEFFRACGLQGNEIDPKEAEGKIVRAVFYASANGKSGIIGFEPCQQETRNESDA